MTALAAPDAIALVVRYLRGQSILVGVTIGTCRPDELASKLPYILVERVGGAPRQRRGWRLGRPADRVRVGLQVWAGPNLASARTVTHATLATLFAARSVEMPDGVIARVDALGDPVPASDRAAGAGVHRFVAMIDVTVRR